MTPETLQTTIALFFIVCLLVGGSVFGLSWWLLAKNNMPQRITGAFLFAVIAAFCLDTGLFGLFARSMGLPFYFYPITLMMALFIAIMAMWLIELNTRPISTY